MIIYYKNPYLGKRSLHYFRPFLSDFAVLTPASLEAARELKDIFWLKASRKCTMRRKLK